MAKVCHWTKFMVSTSVPETRDGTSSTRQRLSVKLHRELTKRIIDGIYRPHAYLPAERQLAKDFRTSRVTMAKALDALECEGLVTRTRGRGTRVLPISERLSKPLIAIVHGDLSASAQADSLTTLQGAKDRMAQLACRCELHFSQKKDLLQAAARFGAMVLVGPGFLRDELVELENQHYPIVVAKQEVEMDVSATWVDHETQIKEAVRTFVRLGHRRIAFVGREPSYAFYGKARRGYLAAMSEAELPVEESMIGTCKNTDALSGYLVTKTLLAADETPTAIIVARDSIAEGVCHALREADFVLGRDVSVIGFDDITWPGGREFLTTFREPCYEMGAGAADLLVERIVGEWRPPEKRMFEASLVLRRSAGPLVAEESQRMST
jgi:DNA-binding LacI/PurR family transcriptional regulator